MSNFVCSVELSFAVEPTSRDTMYQLLSAVPGGNHRMFEPVAGKPGVFELDFDFETDTVARADEIAKTYVDRAMLRLERYASRVVKPCSCIERAARPAGK